MWFVDIAYDEIPERHYKESEVSGVYTVTSGPPKVKSTRAWAANPQEDGEMVGKAEEAAWGWTNGIVLSLTASLLGFFLF